MSEDYLEDAPEGENETPKEEPKKTPGWDREGNRERVYAKSDVLRGYKESAATANRREYLGEGLPEDEREYKRSEWNSAAESEEMEKATDKFLKENHITGKSPLMDKISDPAFYMQFGDVLEARRKGDYDSMFRMIKNHAERELELDARRRYIRTVQDERSGGLRESFQAYRARMAKAGR